MILVYTGAGKGKTSACAGQAVRAHGQGLRVAFGQFMKRPGQAGEQAVLRDLLGDDFMAGGLGFFRKEEDRPEHRDAALALVRWAAERMPVSGMLILDEALYALGSGLVTRRELELLMVQARQQDTHLVLSGRGLPEWLLEEADLVTEMGEVKHPHQHGVKAGRGIEF